MIICTNVISIHALLTESDYTHPIGIPVRVVFLSTLSLRRATYQRQIDQKSSSISIHALLTESDRRGESCYLDNIDFYPRSPYGERHPKIRLSLSIMDFYPRSPYGERQPALYQLYDTYAFLSTLSLRRATWARGSRVTYVEFLSTLSLRRATPQKPSHHRNREFLSTLSLRRATRRASRQQPAGEISIHALLTESDLEGQKRAADVCRYFYPRSPYGERRAWTLNINGPLTFLSTLSLRRATRRSVKLFRQNYISIHALLTESDIA